jgi:predicted transcriptional regulator
MLDKLPERQREAFVMYHVDDLPEATIAEYLGISQPAVSKLLSKAKRKLATLGVTVPNVYLGGGRKSRRAPNVSELVI